MTENEKTFLKMSILGILGGGATAALAANWSDEEMAKKDKSSKNDIVVPLSRKNFMRSVGRKSKASRASSSSIPALPASTQTAESVKKDISQMSAKDLADYKRLLLKGASYSAPTNPKKTGPESMTISMRSRSNLVNSEYRDEKGRFISPPQEKKAFPDIFSNHVWDPFMRVGGAVGGVAVGTVAMRKILDKIRLDRENRKLDKYRKQYTEMLSPESTEKTAGNPITNTLESALGYGGTYLGMSALATGMVAYKIIENRRKAAEKASDKDMNKYPDDKVIKYKFV